jgi:hypothetical protein
MKIILDNSEDNLISAINPTWAYASECEDYEDALRMWRAVASELDGMWNMLNWMRADLLDDDVKELLDDLQCLQYTAIERGNMVFDEYMENF